MSEVKRKCLMLSDLQSGAYEVEYVLASDYDAALARIATLAAQLKEARTLLDRLGFELSEWSKGLYTYRCVACDEGDETTLRKEDIKHLPNCALDAFLNKTKEPTT